MSYPTPGRRGVPLWLALLVAAAVAALIVLVVVMVDRSGDHTSTVSPAVSTSSSGRTAPDPRLRTVLDQSGKGITNTRAFTVTAEEWAVDYTYRCPPDIGLFSITLYQRNGDPADVLANRSDQAGSARSYGHGAGTYYLDVNTTCDWRVRVTG
jgi:hypothetical protein